MTSVLVNPLSAIKTIQTGTITITAGNTSNTATITSVSTTKSVIVPLGLRDDTVPAYSADTAQIGSHFASCILTNATTVTATRQKDSSPGGSSIIVPFQVVEYTG